MIILKLILKYHTVNLLDARGFKSSSVGGVAEMYSRGEKNALMPWALHV